MLGCISRAAGANAEIRDHLELGVGEKIDNRHKDRIDLARQQGIERPSRRAAKQPRPRACLPYNKAVGRVGFEPT